MATQITSTDLESDIADDIVTRLGANCRLRHFTSGDVELATHISGTATKNLTTTPDSVDITGLQDDTADTGTVSYSVLATSANDEIIRFTDPVNDIGLSSTSFTSGQTVSVTSLSVTVPA